MDLEEEVKTHTRRVEGGERVRYGHACPVVERPRKSSFGCMIAGGGSSA